LRAAAGGNGYACVVDKLVARVARQTISTAHFVSFTKWVGQDAGAVLQIVAIITIHAATVCPLRAIRIRGIRGVGRGVSRIGGIGGIGGVGRGIGGVSCGIG